MRTNIHEYTSLLPSQSGKGRTYGTSLGDIQKHGRWRIVQSDLCTSSAFPHFCVWVASGCPLCAKNLPETGNQRSQNPSRKCHAGFSSVFLAGVNIDALVPPAVLYDTPFPSQLANLLARIGPIEATPSALEKGGLPMPMLHLARPEYLAQNDVESPPPTDGEPHQHGLSPWVRTVRHLQMMHREGMSSLIVENRKNETSNFSHHSTIHTPAMTGRFWYCTVLETKC